jgi:hypothetical protein
MSFVRRKELIADPTIPHRWGVSFLQFGSGEARCWMIPTGGVPDSATVVT